MTYVSKLMLFVCSSDSHHCPFMDTLTFNSLVLFNNSLLLDAIDWNYISGILTLG
ncbi:hypothetical protein NARC_10419 [Candidatus Nitrosocosmicus arcticus]|uniref:Uncharacterized protein n=1 Tax=Candidatus Nitrosocosmicus arcticus TaxID=2035267 RepID=A0A557SZI8_9ARCH|nr:hypothetical protein NARC_10419 [Candidatus Nitrosocosmicus arcticus]